MRLVQGVGCHLLRNHLPRWSLSLSWYLSSIKSSAIPKKDISRLVTLVSNSLWVKAQVKVKAQIRVPLHTYLPFATSFQSNQLCSYDLLSVLWYAGFQGILHNIMDLALSLSHHMAWSCSLSSMVLADNPFLATIESCHLLLIFFRSTICNHIHTANAVSLSLSLPLSPKGRWLKLKDTIYAKVLAHA